MDAILAAHRVLSSCALEGGGGSEQREAKVRACRSLAEHSALAGERGVFALAIAALLRIHADSDLALWAVAEESLAAVLSAAVRCVGVEAVLIELFKGVRSGERDKVKRVALSQFVRLLAELSPQKTRKFVVALLPILLALVTACSEPVMETLAAQASALFAVFSCYMKEKEVREVIGACAQALKAAPSAACRRACGDVAAALCASFSRSEWEFAVRAVLPLLQGECPTSQVQGALLYLTSLCREAAVLSERPRHSDPRVPLNHFADSLLSGIILSCLERPDACQAAAELCARIPASALSRQNKTSIKNVLRGVLSIKRPGSASIKASALKALAAWGGDKMVEPASADDDPLVLGTTLLVRAKRGLGADEVISHFRNESSVVARFAYEAAGEFLTAMKKKRRKFQPPEASDNHGSGAGDDAAQEKKMSVAVLREKPCDYWVVEKQRLTVIAAHALSLEPLFSSLAHSDARVRAAAAEGLAVYGDGIDVADSVSDMNQVQERAWKFVPALMQRLLKILRLNPTNVGAHLAMRHLAKRWSSPRRYLKAEGARLLAEQQRPLHASWPNPVHGLFGPYAGRAIAHLVASAATLMCSLEHHQAVLECCAALATGGGASSAPSVWPDVLLHSLRVIRLFDKSADPMDVGDDCETLNGGGVPYSLLQARLATVHSMPAYMDMLNAALKVVAVLCKDVSRPVAAFGHLILQACRAAFPIAREAVLVVCRCMAPLCFRPATTANTNVLLSPAGKGAPQSGASSAAGGSSAAGAGAKTGVLYVPSALAYTSGLGRPAQVAEDFPAVVNFSAARVEVALRMRPLLPSLLEPIVLRAMELYPETHDVKVKAKTLDLVVTLIRCGVDYKRLDPKANLVLCIQQQIVGKRSFLRDPMRVLPCMYSFISVLVSEDASGPVDSAFLLQVAAPVFSSSYWRSNAKLVPSLRWLLRDLYARRRLQMQRAGGDEELLAAEDPFQHTRVHFVSCVVAKLPHDEAVEQLDVLLRAARPVKALMEEIAAPAIKAIRALAVSGKIVMWRPYQWAAWKNLLTKLAPLASSGSGSASSEGASATNSNNDGGGGLLIRFDDVSDNSSRGDSPAPQGVAAAVDASSEEGGSSGRERMKVSLDGHTLDVEDPDLHIYHACRPLGKLCGLIVLHKLDGASHVTDKEPIQAAFQEAWADKSLHKAAHKLIVVLDREMNAKQQQNNKVSATSASHAPSSDATQQQHHHHLHRVKGVGGGAFVSGNSLLSDLRRPVDLSKSSSNGGGGSGGLPGASFNPKSEFPLLNVESVSSSDEVPDELFPLADAFYRHSAKLLMYRSLLSRSQLDHILLSAEGLVLAGHGDAASERALDCLRGAILRPAATAMITAVRQCPRNDMLKVSIKPLWKMDDGDDRANVAHLPRSLLWRHVTVCAEQDEDDTLFGFVPATLPPTLPPPVAGTSCCRLYGLTCRLIRSPTKQPAAFVWARQALQGCKVGVLQQALHFLLESSGAELLTSMDVHEELDVMLKSLNPQVYCVDAPSILISDRVTSAQAMSLIFSNLIRCIRSDASIGGIVHVILRALPRLQDVNVQLYVPSLRVEIGETALFRNLLTVFACCLMAAKTKDASWSKKAHVVAHSLYKEVVDEFQWSDDVRAVYEELVK